MLESMMKLKICIVSLFILLLWGCSKSTSGPSEKLTLLTQSEVDSLQADSLQKFHANAVLTSKSTAFVDSNGAIGGVVEAAVDITLLLVVSETDGMRVKFKKGVYDEHLTFTPVSKSIDLAELGTQIEADSHICNGDYLFTLVAYSDFQIETGDTTTVPLVRDTLLYSYQKNPCQ